METTTKVNPTLSEAELKEELKNRYDFDILNCNLINNERNTIYALDNETSKYIFKIYEHNGKDLEELQGEIELENLLHHGGASIAYPISDKEGNFIQHLVIAEDVLYGVTYSFAEGKTSYLMNDEQLASTGKQLAIIHQITSDPKLHCKMQEYTLNAIILDSLQKIKPFFTDLEKEYDDLYEASIKVLHKFESLDLSELTSGYCHNDFCHNNFHFREDNSIIIFDFENMRKGFLILDIASIYCYYFLLHAYGGFTIPQAAYAFNVFIESYLSTRKLSDLELQLIPYFCLGVLMNSIKFKTDYQTHLLTTDKVRALVEKMQYLINGQILVN